MNNSSILAAQTAFKLFQHNEHLSKLRNSSECLKDVSYEELSKIFSVAVSCFQSKGGKFLERHVEGLLKEANIPFKSQPHLSCEGIFVESNGITIPDIVFGNPQFGDSVTDYIVLSLKTTSRERSKLDDWTKKNPPKLFLYATLEDDYPQPKTFEEGPTRKLICATAKKRDLRQFKLGFEHLIEEVRSLIKS